MERRSILNIQVHLRQHFLLIFLLVLHHGVMAAAAAETAGEEEETKCNETALLTFSTHDLELVAKEHENGTAMLQAKGSLSSCLAINFTYDPSDPSVEPLDDFTLCPNQPTTTPSPSTAPPKRCRDCEDEHEEAPRVISFSSPTHSRLSPPLHLHRRVARVVGVAGRESSGEGVVANSSVEFVSRWVGKTVVGVVTNDSCVEVTDAFVRVSVVHSRALDTTAAVIGWMYTILWDVSFLPQVVLNWRRKSVEGFSFDNTALNIVAFLYYALFNIAFFYVPFIQNQFKERYPRTVNHVQANDVFFATYAFLIEIVLAIQCFMYRSGKEQRVSWPCMALIGISLLAVGVDCVLVAVGVQWWLDVFYLMSYMKLAITPLKYIPQVYVNYKCKSTKGFSIFGATMDFSGGVLSLLQMFLLSANNNDFRSIFTDFSKFGLGVITLIFDVTYFTQHWYYHIRKSK